MQVDQQKLEEVALALLGMTLHEDRGVQRVWKGLDWDLMDALFKRGWISDPKSKAKSVVLSDDGARLVEELFEKHFGTV